jgi:hypothetical protein
MEPITVTITDEIAYHALLEAEANGVLHQLGDICKTLAEMAEDSKDIERFHAEVNELAGHLYESGTWRQLPEDDHGRVWIEEFGKRR